MCTSGGQKEEGESIWVWSDNYPLTSAINKFFGQLPLPKYLLKPTVIMLMVDEKISDIILSCFASASECPAGVRWPCLYPRVQIASVWLRDQNRGISRGREVKAIYGGWSDFFPLLQLVIKIVFVWLTSGYCNKNTMDWVASTTFISPSLEAGKSKIKEPADSVSAESWLLACRQQPSCSRDAHMMEGERVLWFLQLLIRALIPSWGLGLQDFVQT